MAPEGRISPCGPRPVERHADRGAAAGSPRFLKRAGHRARHPARPRRAQGVLTRRPGAAARPSPPPTAAGSRSGPSPVPFDDGQPRPARADASTRSRAWSGSSRDGRAPGAGRRLRGRRDPRRPRLPDRRVPLPAQQPPHRRVRRLASRTGCGSPWRSSTPCARCGREELPLFFRISATDWLDEGGWTADDTVRFATELHARGVDLLDASTGGNAAGVAHPASAPATRCRSPPASGTRPGCRSPPSA